MLSSDVFDNNHALTGGAVDDFGNVNVTNNIFENNLAELRDGCCAACFLYCVLLDCLLTLFPIHDCSYEVAGLLYRGNAAVVNSTAVYRNVLSTTSTSFMNNSARSSALCPATRGSVSR